MLLCLVFNWHVEGLLRLNLGATLKGNIRMISVLQVRQRYGMIMHALLQLQSTHMGRSTCSVADGELRHVIYARCFITIREPGVYATSG